MITHATSVTRETCETVTYGCAWHGCDRPIAWCEAHHLAHWSQGGPTTAENLILLCRFHHGRIHTNGWTVTKTGPGKAVIVHHEGHAPDDAPGRGDCADGCADWRTDTDMDVSFKDDPKNFFPTGLYPHEWSEAMLPDLEAVAAQVKEAKAYYAFGGSAAEFDTRDLGSVRDDGAGAGPKADTAPVTDPPPIYGERDSNTDLIPF